MPEAPIISHPAQLSALGILEMRVGPLDGKPMLVLGLRSTLKAVEFPRYALTIEDALTLTRELADECDRLVKVLALRQQQEAANA